MQGLVGKTQGRRPLGRTRRRWSVIPKLILKKVWDIVDWIDLAQNCDIRRAFANTVMNMRVS